MSDLTLRANGEERASRGQSPVPQQESKHDKFVRLAQSRVQRALDALDLVAKLKSPAYEYSDDEAGKILYVLGEKVDEIDRMLRRRQKPMKTRFSFE